MVRHRWTLALILISVLILATVITAFRVRDLPRSSLDGSKPVSKKLHRCENCDVNELDRSLKIESVKHSYDDKKLIDKQRLVINKVAEDNNDDEDNAIEDLQKNNYVGVKIQDRSKRKYIKDGTSVEQEKKKSRDDHETDDDDDDDDDDDNDEINTVKRNIKQVQTMQATKTKVLLGKKTLMKTETVKAVKIDDEDHDDNDDDNDDDDDDDDEDVADDDDDDDDDDGTKNLKQSSKEQSKTSKVLKKTFLDSSDPVIKIGTSSSAKTGSNENIDNDDEDDDDDDDEDDSGDETTKNGQTSKIKITNIKKNLDLEKSKSGIEKIKETKTIINNDEIDDEGDDDDDDVIVASNEGQLADHKVEKKVLIQTNMKIIDKKHMSQSTLPKPGVIEKNKIDKDGEDNDGNVGDEGDNDDDDDEDDDDDDDDYDNISAKSLNRLMDSKIKPEKTLVQEEKIKDAKDTDKSKKDKDKLDDKKEAVDRNTAKTKSKPQGKREVKVSVVVKKELDSFFEGEGQKKEIPKKVKQDIDKSKKSEKKKHEKKDIAKETVKEDKQTTPKKVIKFDKEKNKLMEKEWKKDRRDIDNAVQEKQGKTDMYIKQVSEVLQRKNLLQSEFEDFYAFFPTFAPNFSRLANPECRRHGQILLRQLRGTKLWALNILDATAKIPSGILQGNGIQLGDFDQCLNSRARVQLDTGTVVKVQGKYCLARLEVKAEHSELEAPVHLAQAKNLFNSRIDDPGHFVPRFSTLSWGVCVPGPCHAGDVETIIKDAIKHYQHKIGVAVRVKVDDIDCHTRHSGKWWEKWMELPTLVTLAFYGVIVLIVIVATLLDYSSRDNAEEVEDDKGESNEPKAASVDGQEGSGNNEKKSGGFLSSFSLYRTIGKLVGPTRSDEISCIHGVRAISTIALVIGHKFLPTGVTPYTNRLHITETVSSPIWSWTRAGWMFTDSFLLLSGALKAHRVSLIDIVISRYIRLVPALLAVTLFYAYIWDNLSDGPLWGTLVTKNAVICQESWWWNMLFVQNYFKMEEMCAPQTHQLALDMQLSILGWLIILLTKSDSISSRAIVPSVHLLSAYLRYSTVRDHRLSMIAYHGMTVSQIYRTARLSYMSVFHRCSPYLIGLSLGHALRHPGRHGKLFLTLGWLVSTTLWGLVLWAGYDAGSTEYKYNISFAAKYAALAPIASSIALAWLIYVVHGGYCGFLSRILSCRPLLIISRLSYAMYLIQFVVFFTNAATIKTSTEFTLISMIDSKEISAILLSSVILTLTFVTPMQSLYRESPTKSKGDQNDESKEDIESITEQDVVESEKKAENEEHNEAPPVKRQSLLAHREHLEEIPEVEVEYESQRDSTEGLEEILEEEEDESLQDHLEDDLEIIEEEQEQGGEDDYWADRREYLPTRSYSRNSDRDLDEWEWTANGQGRNGAQHYRNNR